MKFFKEIKDRKELENEIKKLEIDVEREIKGFAQIKELEQKKIEILTRIEVLWRKRWEEAERFVKDTIPSCIRKQLAYIEEDAKLAEDERLVIYLMEKGAARTSYWEFDEKTKQYFFELIKTEKNLEKELIGLFEPIRSFYKNLKITFEKQLKLFQQEKIWDLINKNQQILYEMKKENEKIQKWNELCERKYATISHHVRTTRILVETNFDDPNTIKDFLEKVKEKCGFNLFGSEGGYRTIYQKNIPEKTQDFIERICELPTSIIGGKLRSTAYPGFVKYDAELGCNEVVSYQIYNAPTKAVLTKCNDEKPTIFIYYGLHEGFIKGRQDRLSATLILGAEDATKLLIYFKKNLSRVYDFFRQFHDRFNTKLITRNGKMLFVPVALNEIIDYKERIFNVKEEFFKEFILTY